MRVRLVSAGFLKSFEGGRELGSATKVGSHMELLETSLTLERV
jgi:hypothetical protein